MTGYSFTTPVWEGGRWVVSAIVDVRAAPRANGPEDPPRDAPVQWDETDWRAQEAQVRRLRQRIFKAAQEQDWPKVRILQKLMLRSRSNTLVSVRQVTQRNAGRKTAGIDGEVALTSEARTAVAERVHRSRSSWQPRAVRRVYIPKASNRAKLRPLGIPVLMERCHQARVRNALEPEGEARDPSAAGAPRAAAAGCGPRGRRRSPDDAGRAGRRRCARGGRGGEWPGSGALMSSPVHGTALSADRAPVTVVPLPPGPAMSRPLRLAG